MPKEKKPDAWRDNWATRPSFILWRQTDAAYHYVNLGGWLKLDPSSMALITAASTGDVP